MSNPDISGKDSGRLGPIRTKKAKFGGKPSGQIGRKVDFWANSLSRHIPGSYCTVPSFFRHGARSTFRGRTRRSRFWEMRSRDTGARRRLNGRWQLRPIRSALGRWQPLKSLLKGVQDCLLFGEPFGPSSSFRQRLRRALKRVAGTQGCFIVSEHVVPCAALDRKSERSI